MKNLLKFLFIIFMSNIILYAVGNIPASEISQYSVTIKKIEVFNSTTGKWIQMSNGSSTIDIASVSAGADVGAMLSQDAALTFGTYTKIRTTIGNSFTVKACITSPVAACTATTSVSGSHTVIVALTGTGVATAQTMIVDFSAVTLPTDVSLDGSDVQVEYTLGTPIVIGQDSASPSIKVDFNVNNVLTSATLGVNLDAHGGNDAYIIVDFPTVSVSVE